MLLARITLPHFSRSLFAYAPICAGVLGIASRPRVWKRALTAVVLERRDQRLVQRGDDLRRRAGRHHQPLPGIGLEALQPLLVEGRQLSKPATRFGLATPIARSLPERMCG